MDFIRKWLKKRVTAAENYIILIRRIFSTKIYKHARLMLSVGIFLLNLAVIGIGGLLIHLIAPESYVSPLVGIWQIITDVLDPGFLSNYATDQGTKVTVLIEVIVIIICMITFTGAIIGSISSAITTFLENYEAGPKRMYLKDHIIILNWNHQAAGIITEYLYTEICEDVVVLTTQDRNRITKEIEDSIFEQGYTRSQKHVNFVVKQGEPFSYSELESVCAKKARTIIVLSDSDPQEGDLRTLKTVMMVSQMNQGREDCTIVVETDNQNIYELVTRMQGRESHLIVPAYLNKLLGKMLAHIALQPELNIVFAEIFSHNGNEFYSIPFTKMADLNEEETEEEVLTHFIEAYNHAIPLVTSKSFNSDSSNKLFVLAERQSDCLKMRLREQGRRLPAVKLKESFVIPKKILVLLGSNSKLRYMIYSFEAYIRNYGEDKLKIYFVDTEEHLEQVPECSSFEKVLIQDRYNVMEIRKVLKSFDLTEINTIVILSDDTVSQVQYDSGALISLIDINRELETIDKNKRPEVIVEILNPKNHEIVQQYNIDNVIVSNRYISSMMALLGDDDSVFELIYDILTFDKELDDFGQTYANKDDSKELYVKRCGDYFESSPIPYFHSPAELIRAVFYASNKQHVVVGVIYADESKNQKQMDFFDRSYIFPSNLDNEERGVRLKEDDRLIIFSSGW